jgi:hypothetical protein
MRAFGCTNTHTSRTVSIEIHSQCLIKLDPAERASATPSTLGGLVQVDCDELPRSCSPSAAACTAQLLRQTRYSQHHITILDPLTGSQDIHASRSTFKRDLVACVSLVKWPQSIEATSLRPLRSIHSDLRQHGIETRAAAPPRPRARRAAAAARAALLAVAERRTACPR